MARFSGEYRESFVVDAPIDEVRAHFADLATIARNYGQLRSFEIHDEHEISFELEPKVEKGVRFHGQYRGRYEVGDDGVLRWRTVGTRNMWSSGEARFTRVDDGRTQVDFRQRVDTEMQVNTLLGKLIRPIVNREISKGTREYLERMRAELG